jgi:4-amino-4-deoxy-L-arabinose transferase-like glycosyltransferase
LVSAFHFLIPDLIAAGLAANWLALYGLFISVYVLGRITCDRKVGLLAILPVATSIALYNYVRHLQTWVFFSACVVWCVILYLLLVRRPGFFRASLLGLLLVLTFYTRLEGITYSLLIVAAAGQIYRSTRKGWHTLGLMVVSGGLVLVGAFFYFLILLRYSDPTSGDAFAVLKLLRANPIDWQAIGQRVTELIQSLLYLWPLGAWLLVLGGAIITRSHNRSARILFISLIMVNIFNLFFIAIAPTPQLTLPALPFLALLSALVLVQFARQYRAWWFVVPLLMLTLVIHGTRTLIRYTAILASPYWETVQAQDARAIDTWLAERQLQTVEVYTFCSEVLPYTRSHLQLIYRLAIRPWNNPDWWNTPEHLLPQIWQNHQLLMLCPNKQLFFPDWNAYLSQLPNHPDWLEKIGMVGQYEFYRVRMLPTAGT